MAAAIDVRRAGYTSAIPRALLDQVHEQYLADPEHAYARRESSADAWAWATRRRRATTALLRPARPELVEVFDYLVDTVQRGVSPLGLVPEPVVLAAIDSAGPADADSLATTAYAQGRYALAERAWRRAYQTRAADPAIGPDHSDTLASGGNLARVLRRLGRLVEAETEQRAVLEARVRVLGAEHPDTLASRHSLANVLRNSGRLEEAESEQRAALEARMRVLGAEHPETVKSRNSLGGILRDRGRPGEAEAEHARPWRLARDCALRTRRPWSAGTASPATCALGVPRRRLNPRHRAVLETRLRVLGAEHPETLGSRDGLAADLRDLGRLEEAAAEYRSVWEARVRVLGPDHPDTLKSRDGLHTVLRDLRRLTEAESNPVWADRLPR